MAKQPLRDAPDTLETVADLIAFLQTFSPTMPLVQRRYSDFQLMPLDPTGRRWPLWGALVRVRGWLQRHHPSMGEDTKIEALAFMGN